MGKFKDLTGKIINGVKVLHRDGQHPTSGTTMWKIYCLYCQKEKTIRSDSIQFQNKACGCQSGPIKHRLSVGKHVKLYDSYKNMIDRCYNRKNKRFRYYGGRGIIVCDEWKDRETGLFNFYIWAQPVLDKLKLQNPSLERIDVNGNYEPGNCTWIEFIDQCKNKQNTIYLNLYPQEKIRIKEAMQKYNSLVSYECILNRLKKGWSDKDAFFTPILKGK